MIEIVFETHSWSTDNERGIATGWLPGALSERGEALARELGERRRDTGLAAVFCSDLRRAVQTGQLAFAGSDLPILLDWRLRECDYGRLNGAPAATVHADRQAHLTEPYPDGESWQQAIDRVGRVPRRPAVPVGRPAGVDHRSRGHQMGTGPLPERRSAQ